jgi:hypothetical protein
MDFTWLRRADDNGGLVCLYIIIEKVEAKQTKPNQQGDQR